MERYPGLTNTIIYLFVGMSLLFLFLFRHLWTYSLGETLSLLFCLFSLGALVITWEIFKRKILADKGRFWVRVPFMKYLAIEVDRVLKRVLVACTDEVWRRIHPECTDNKGKVCSDVVYDGRVKLERVHKGLVWIGVPWKYRVKEWYETESDELDPTIQPLHSVGLEEQVLRYSRQSEPEKKEDEESQKKYERSEISVPSLQTADLIELFADLMINTVVYNPIKALYYIRHRKTAIFNMILPVWREVVGSFFFFEYGDALEKDFKAVVGKKIVKLSQKFRVVLGISTEDADEKESFITDPAQLVAGTVAHMIFNEWGTLIRYAAVEDADPADPEIKKTFEKMITAVTGALALKQSAEGERDAAIIKGEGYKSDESKFKLAMETIQALAASGNLIISLPETSEAIAGFIGGAMKSFHGGEKK